MKAPETFEVDLFIVDGLFCLGCGSSACEVSGWRDERTAIFRCWTCGHETDVEGFTTSSVEVPVKEIEEARAFALGHVPQQKPAARLLSLVPSPEDPDD